jgi:putative heme-binding domain-containing protein
MKITTIVGIAMMLIAGAAGAQTPEWIWHPEKKDNQSVMFRMEFTLEKDVESAIVSGSCVNEMRVYSNGEQLTHHTDWRTVAIMEATQFMKKGRNTLAARGQNNRGAAGLFLRMTVTHTDGSKTIIVTDKNWKFAEEPPSGWSRPGYDDSNWKSVKVIGDVGDSSLNWTRRINMASVEQAELTDLNPTVMAQEVDTLNLLPGFKAELVYTVPKASQGSWVSMTNAPDGGLFVSDQDGAGIFHVRPATLGVSESTTVVTKLPVRISSAQGLFWAFDSLYVHVNGGNRSGLYRITDSDENGDLDNLETLMKVSGSGEHGPHAIIYTEDKQNLYINAGNHTDLPEITGSRQPAVWQEDLLLPRQWDARGHARGRMAPGGWICRVTPDGQSWEVVSHGYRNEYDIAMNTENELFAYDADMEWDFGSPWYRPTRICHAVSGSEFGWRSGTGKWPTYYEDSLPPVLNIGPGSPTGIVFGTNTQFPAKYQQALFTLDWTFGTIYAIHMTPEGASYTATKEEFVSGSPLAVTDTVIGADGAFYFTVGGRGSQSYLYRVYYDGNASTAPTVRKESQDTIDARALRRSLELYHGGEHPDAVKTAWPHLGHEDRFIRFAARVAIENQPVNEWKREALRERDPQAAAVALIALARMGEKSDQDDLLEALNQFDVSTLNETAALGLLRAYALAFTRMGRPDQDTIDAVIARLDPHLPSDSDDMNTELARLLVYLDAPGVIEKGLALMASAKPVPIPDWAELIKRNQGYGGTIQKMLDNHPPSGKINYAFMLRNVRYGWTMAQREEYFTFINEAAKYPGGSSFSGFLANCRDEALANCSEAEKVALAHITGKSLDALPAFEITRTNGRKKELELKKAVNLAKRNGLKGRDYENGRNAFYAASCADCHRFDGAGGAVGPDLSTVSHKFSIADLLEAIIEPNNAISDQYGSSLVTLNDDTFFEGIVVNQSGSQEVGEMFVYTRDPKEEPILVKTADVKSIEPSPVSQMPDDLSLQLDDDELLDLLAYLMSRGNPDAPEFK